MDRLIDYAKKEFEIAFPEPEGDDFDIYMQQTVIDNVLELLETFSKQNHSGLSASYVLQQFYRLAFFRPLTPLTGRDDEWGEANKYNVQQNKRCFSVFRENYDNATAYDISRKVFKDDNGFTYLSRGSCVPITFPYEVPDKPEIIKVSAER